MLYVFPNEAEFQWSILIVLYPFITGLVAGAFVVSSLYHVFGMKALAQATVAQRQPGTVLSR